MDTTKYDHLYDRSCSIGIGQFLLLVALTRFMPKIGVHTYQIDAHLQKSSL